MTAAQRVLEGSLEGTGYKLGLQPGPFWGALPPIHTNSQGGKRLQERPTGQEPGGPQGTRTLGRTAECLSVASLTGKSSESGRPSSLRATQAESRGCPEAGGCSSWRAEVWEERGRGSENIYHRLKLKPSQNPSWDLNPCGWDVNPIKTLPGT